ncbi:MAG TPA: type II restriction endonuclease [bacterium]|nr:type II restriction endonuclease [bacterium]HOM26413.1 type II restriction endonuclease [bacterium]
MVITIILLNRRLGMTTILQKRKGKLETLKQNWKENLPELPEINFDRTPEESFKEIKDLELRYWRKILENEKLWEEGIMNVLFKEGKTLSLLYNFFREKEITPYKNLETMLVEKLKKYWIKGGEKND